MTVIEEDVLFPSGEDQPAEEPMSESWIGEQTRLLTLEDGFAS